MLKKEVMKVRIKGTSRLLGSVTSDKEVYSNFLVTKTKTDEELRQAKEDIKNLPDEDAQEFVEKQTTGFYRDEEGNLILKAYQIKGFIKEAAKALKSQIKLASAVSKIDNLVFVNPRTIYITRNGEKITKPDGILERPLRAETMMGPRISLAKSEYIEEGWEAEFSISILDNEATAKSKKVTSSMLESILEYGEYKGLLQWRNAGNGSFVTEILDVTTTK